LAELRSAEATAACERRLHAAVDAELDAKLRRVAEVEQRLARDGRARADTSGSTSGSGCTSGSARDSIEEVARLAALVASLESALAARSAQVGVLDATLCELTLMLGAEQRKAGDLLGLVVQTLLEDPIVDLASVSASASVSAFASAAASASASAAATAATTPTADSDRFARRHRGDRDSRASAYGAATALSPPFDQSSVDRAGADDSQHDASFAFSDAADSRSSSSSPSSSSAHGSAASSPGPSVSEASFDFGSPQHRRHDAVPPLRFPLHVGESVDIGTRAADEASSSGNVDNASANEIPKSPSAPANVGTDIFAMLGVDASAAASASWLSGGSASPRSFASASSSSSAHRSPLSTVSAPPTMLRASLSESAMVSASSAVESAPAEKSAVASVPETEPPAVSALSGLAAVEVAPTDAPAAFSVDDALLA
jgi:hypothetical protein